MKPAFWKDRRVFITGHTGFKGAWLTNWLVALGARVSGFSLPTPTTPSLFALTAPDLAADVVGDIRDLGALSAAMGAAEPEIVLHLAAQSLVRRSYENPVETYATNVMGTVHVLEALRRTPSVRAAVMVTSDKCYENDETGHAFLESDRFGGHDPYSNSKGCAELVTAAYRASYFGERNPSCAVASARAGNVVGGGDWSRDRLIPDILAAHEKGERVEIRSPASVRPWQHVLDCLDGYLTLTEALCGPDGASCAEGWNFGPPADDCLTVRGIVEIFHELLGTAWDQTRQPQPHEAAQLRLESGKARMRLGWEPRLSADQAVRWTAEWHRQLWSGTQARAVTQGQIAAYMDLAAATSR